MSAGCKGRAAVRAGVWPARVMGCALVAAGFWVGGVASVAGQCEVGFAPGFGYAGVNGTVNAIAEYDDGTGPAIYVAGEFTIAGEVPVSSIARWDGGQWSDVGGGMTAGVGFQIYVLCVFDDGSGPSIYAGGRFDAKGGVPARGIARWDGKRWTDVGGSIADGVVYAMTVHDFGDGPELVIGGWFEEIGSVKCSCVARWNGSRWAPVGPEARIEGYVSALAAFDAGDGPELYAGGTIYEVDGNPVGPIIRWDGTAWRDTKADLVGASGRMSPIRALKVFDDGTGPALYAGGLFRSANSNEFQTIARWDGESWSPVGAGLPVYSSHSGSFGVNDLQVGRRDGQPVLYAAGQFRTYDRKGEHESLAWWDGEQWTFYGQEVGPAILQELRALYVQPTADVERLWVGGRLYHTGDLALDGVAVVDSEGCGQVTHSGGRPWSFELLGQLATPTRQALLGVHLRDVHQWDGRAWRWVGTADEWDSKIHRLRTIEWNGAQQLFLLGSFPSFNGVSAENVVCWDGELWRPFADNAMFWGDVFDVVVHDDGRGPALFFAGRWYFSRDELSPGVIRWDGTGWSRLEEGMPNTVFSLAVYDDGSGPLLYAAGNFEYLFNGMPARSIAVWNGHWWSGVGDDPTGWGSGKIVDMEAYDDGDGPKLYVAGDFSSSPAPGAATIARWDGTRWSAVGTGLPGEILDLERYDDGYGPALYAAGRFLNPGSGVGGQLARWRGVLWEFLIRDQDPYENYIANSLVAHNDGFSSRLFVSGDFEWADDVRSMRVAAFGPSARRSSVSRSTQRRCPASGRFSRWRRAAASSLSINGFAMACRSSTAATCRGRWGLSS